MRYNDTPAKMANIKKTDDTQFWRGCEATGTLLHCWQKCKIVQLLWQFLKKLNI